MRESSGEGEYEKLQRYIIGNTDFKEYYTGNRENHIQYHIPLSMAQGYEQRFLTLYKDGTWKLAKTKKINDTGMITGHGLQEFQDTFNK